MTVGMRVAGSRTEAYSYDVPAPQGLFFNIPPGKTAVSSAFVLKGLNFGTADNTPLVTVGGSACARSGWIADTAVTCRATEGIGSTKDVSITIAVAVGTITQAISYDIAALNRFTSPQLGVAGVYLDKGGNAPATGASSVTLTGEDFGTFDTSAQMRPGGTGVETTRWASDTVVAAKVAAGTAEELGVTVTVATKFSTLTDAFTYDRVTPIGPLQGALASGPSSNAPMLGGTLVTVVASNFGHSGYSGVARVGSSACQSSSWVSESAIVCKESTGLANSHAIIMSLAKQQATLSVAFTYNRPALRGSTATNQASDPTGPLTVFGENFGAYRSSARARVAGTSAQATYWFSDTAARCRAAFGLGGSHQLVFTAARGSSGTLTDTLSYDAPSVHALAQGNGPALGGRVLSVSGFSFGRFDASPRAQVAGGAAHGHLAGGTGCEATEWASESALVCVVARGLFSPKDVAATVAVQVATSTSLFTYDRPMAERLVFPNGPASGGLTSTVTGQNFGWLDMSPTVRVGGSMSEATKWLSDSAILVKLTPGAGLALDATVTVAGLLATAVKGYTYDKASVSSPKPMNVPTSGAISITVHGFNFGATSWFISAATRLGGTANEASSWVSDSSVPCKAAAGTVRVASMVLTIERLSAATVSTSLSYDVPLVNGIAPGNVPSNASAVMLVGTGLGQNDISAVGAAGGSAAEATSWLSDTSTAVRFSAGVGSTLRVVVTSGMREGTRTEVVSYDAPSMSSVGGSNSPARGRVRITVVGDSFGGTDYSTAARVASRSGTPTHDAEHLGGGTSCEASAWASVTAMTCRTPRGLLFPKGIALTIARLVGSTTKLLSYDVPMALRAVPPNGPVVGGGLATILGANFGWLDTSARARVGGSACEATAWDSDSGVVCSVSQGVGADRPIAVTMQRMRATAPRLFTYDAAAISAVVPPNAPTSGGLTLLIAGNNFGARDLCPAGQVQGTACEATSWVSDSAVDCRVAAGAGKFSAGAAPDLFVTAALRASTSSGAFSYNRPLVTDISRASAPPEGGVSALLAGAFFGLADYSPVGFVDFQPCRTTEWRSDSSVLCVLPAGYGSGLGVAVAVGSEFGNPFHTDELFAYDAEEVLTTGFVPNTGHEFLVLWLAADALTAAHAGGDAVAAWADLSAHANAVQVLGGAEFRASALNGLPAVHLNASAGGAVRLSSSAEDLLAQVFGGGTFLTRTFVVFLVLRATAVDGGGGARQTYFSASAADGVDDALAFSLVAASAGGTGALQHRVRTIVNANTITAADRAMTADEAFHVLALAHSGFEVRVYKDGSVAPLVQDHDLEAAEGVAPYVRPVRASAADGLLGAMDAVVLGALAAGGNLTEHFEGDVAEVLVYDTDLSAADMDAIGSYLARKYGLFWQVSSGPRVTAVAPANGPSAGGFLITLYGSGFSADAARVTVEVQGVNCSDVRVVTPGAAVAARVPVGAGFADLIVTSNAVTSRAQGLFKFDAPHVTAVRPSVAPAAGGARITLLGQNFGEARHGAVASLAASDGEAACAPTEYVSDSALLCTTPPRTVAAGHAAVAVAAQLSQRTTLAAVAFADVPAYYGCAQGDGCQDCCRSACELAELRRGSSTPPPPPPPLVLIGHAASLTPY